LLTCSGMLLSIIHIFPSHGNEHAVIDVLSSMQGPMAALPDCVGCLVMTEAGGEGSICYLERWRTREALENHLRSTLYSRVLEAIELSEAPPVVEFYEGNGTGGMAYIETVRNPWRQPT